jgi:hypothetical protein
MELPISLSYYVDFSHVEVINAKSGILFVCSSPEAKIKLLERKVNSLVEESCLASSRGEFQLVC